MGDQQASDKKLTDWNEQRRHFQIVWGLVGHLRTFKQQQRRDTWIHRRYSDEIRILKSRNHWSFKCYNLEFYGKLVLRLLWSGLFEESHV